MNRMQAWLAVLAAAMMTGVSGQPASDAPTTIIDAHPAGGGTDVVARVFAQQIGRQSGAAMVVENKPGASGIIGTDFVARAPAGSWMYEVGASSGGRECRRDLPRDQPRFADTRHHRAATASRQDFDCVTELDVQSSGEIEQRLPFVSDDVARGSQLRKLRRRHDRRTGRRVG